MSPAFNLSSQNLNRALSSVASDPAETVPQTVHTPLLAAFGQEQMAAANLETIVPVDSCWTQAYCNWWQDQMLQQRNSSIFRVHLIGHAGNAETYTAVSINDLACCRSVSAALTCCVAEVPLQLRHLS